MQLNQASESAPLPEGSEHVVDIVSAAAQLTRLARTLREDDLPNAMLRAMSVLDERGALRVSEFARIDGCSQPTATTLIGRMAAAGLVSRTADPGDSRAVVVALTPVGRDRLAVSRRAIGTALTTRLPGFDTARLAHLRGELDELLEALKSAA
ncbi:MarR family winged helix-turn-helix transcriptional regulator [Nocardia macrotermitis]|uniref:MarR family winged helix-turn-helix transcriptional regulator n=1 Tax=Nocardia macrotermitis TaxID=2585198 RepID=UPI0029E7F98D|nr:MarR family transcriptional regulator [Nocardia macrotermitis]